MYPTRYVYAEGTFSLTYKEREIPFFSLLQARDRERKEGEIKDGGGVCVEIGQGTLNIDDLRDKMGGGGGRECLSFFWCEKEGEGKTIF